jgi:hypothetical protein
MKIYIALGAILFGVILSPPTVKAQKNKKPLYTAALGIAPYTYRRSFPNGVAATLDTIKNLGFTEIEGGGAGRSSA